MDQEADFDASVASEWQSFQQRLSTHVRQLRDSDVVDLSAGARSAGLSRGHVQLRAHSGGVAVLGLADRLVGAAVLSPSDDVRVDQWWTGHDVDGLQVAWLAKPRERGEELAAVATSVLREVAPSPEFVRVSATGPSAGAFRAGQGEVPGEAGTKAQSRDTTPSHDGEALTVRVVKAVAGFLGATPRVDEHGDLVVTGWEAPVMVRVRGPRASLGKHERVSVFAQLGLYLGQDARTGDVIAEVDAELSGLALHREGDVCVLSADVPTGEFDPERLTEVIRRVGSSVCRVRDRVGERLGGLGSAARTPPELLCLIELAADGGEPLTSAEVAHICGHDRDRILEFVELCASQAGTSQAAARRAHARDEPDMAEEHEQEGATWRELRTALRGALRVVVLATSSRPS